MVTSSGHLIALCGIDGSGKTVQCELLGRHAREAGLRVETVSFPRYGEGFFGELVARYLRGEFAQDPAVVNPYLAALPFACDRWEAAPKIRAWLAEGALVLCNRYVAANLAHQGSKIAAPQARREFLDWLEKLEYGVFQLPRPDLQILLDVPPQIAVELVSRKAQRPYLQQAKDIHENSLVHLRATSELYRHLACGAGWVTIECALSGRLRAPESIAQEVWTAVSRLIYHKS